MFWVIAHEVSTKRTWGKISYTSTALQDIFILLLRMGMMRIQILPVIHIIRVEKGFVK